MATPPARGDVYTHADLFDVDGGVEHDNNKTNMIIDSQDCVRPTWSSSSEMAMPEEEDKGRILVLPGGTITRTCSL